MKTFLVVFFALIACAAPGQKRVIDSLKKVLLTEKADTNKVNALNELSAALADDRDTSMLYAKSALSLSQSLNFKNGEANADYNYAVAVEGKNYIGEQGSINEVLAYLNKAINIFRSFKNDSKIAECYWQISIAYTKLEQNLPDAIKNMLSALSIYEKTGDKQKIASCYMQLGSDYLTENDEDATREGLNDLKTALKIFNEIKDSSHIAYAAHLIGETSTYYKNYNEALKYLNISLETYQAMGSLAPGFGISWTKGSIAEVYVAQGNDAIESNNKKLALEKLQTALKMYKERVKIESAGNMSHRQSYGELGDCYFSLSKISSGKAIRDNLLRSLKYNELLLQIARKANNRSILSDGYYNLSEVSNALGNYKQAFEYYKSFIIYRDSLHNQQNTKKTIRTQMQYDFDEKEDSTKAAEDKKEAIAKAEIQNQKAIRNFSYTGAFVVLSFAGVGFYRYKKRRKLQSQQEMLNERLRISRELHDDIGSTLGSISIYSEVAKVRNEKNQNAEEALSKIGHTSRELIDKMSDIVWSLNPNNESFEELQNRMTAFSSMMLTPRNIVYEFSTNEETKEIKLASGQRKNIFLIFKEAIYNVAKYAESNKVNILLKVENNIFKMVITDDGQGFDLLSFEESRGKVYNGNGIRNMRARAEEMGGKFGLVSGMNKGTTVQLDLNV